MKVPENCQYTDQHEWVRVEGGEAYIGVTDYAQGELGDVVFVELPEPGTEIQKGGVFGTIEAVKTVSDLLTPVSGEIVTANEVLSTDASVVNKSPYEDGWMIKIRMSAPAEANSLMSADDYRKLTG